MVARDGGPAFPRPFSELPIIGGPNSWPQDGMSLRDHFAGLAMQMFIKEYWIPRDNELAVMSGLAISQMSYDIADAMCKEKRHRERIDRNGGE